MNQRIVIIGVTGSGKTTLAGKLAGIWGVNEIELDALYWNAGWTPTPWEVFRTQIDGVLKADGSWIVDGNYSLVRNLIWSRAELLIWLDYPLATSLRFLLKRTLRRTLKREILWGCNRESFRKAFFSRDSIFLWALKSYRQYQQVYPQQLAAPEFSHLSVVHLKSPAETRLWLSGQAHPL
jgi:adenylate kinase family enzyme